jgi:hypothetical protein
MLHSELAECAYLMHPDQLIRLTFGSSQRCGPRHVYQYAKLSLGQAVRAPSDSVLVVFQFPAHRKAVNSVQDVSERWENRFVETEKSGLPGLEVFLEVADVVAFLGWGVY